MNRRFFSGRKAPPINRPAKDPNFGFEAHDEPK